MSQVSERMQESNEWLASAYDELDICEKKIASYEKQIKNGFIFTTITYNILAAAPIAIGYIEYLNGNEARGSMYAKVGVSLVLGVNIAYQGGHWIFKIW